jgi:hypothetical protein
MKITNLQTWFFELTRRRAALAAGLVVVFGVLALRVAHSNDPGSLLTALALGVVAVGLALVLHVESEAHHERLQKWHAEQDSRAQKEKVAALRVANLEANKAAIRETKLAIDGIVRYLGQRQMLALDDVDAMARLAGDMAMEGYMCGVAKNKARFGPGKDY